MTTARHFAALLVLIALPPALLYWFLIHPFAARWRQLGAWPTLAIAFGAMVALGACLFERRAALLRWDLGTQPLLCVLGVALYLLAIRHERRIRRHLETGILLGLPEIDRRRSSVLLDSGPYAACRHPRYANVILATFAVALFANHGSVWLLFALSIPLFYLITVLEERELGQRLGPPYEAYRRRVPRLLPRGARSSGGPDPPPAAEGGP